LDHKKPERLKLFSPGPVNSPAFVLEALRRPLIHHRSPSFCSVYDDITDKIRTLLETQAPVTVVASSATGAMDAVVSSLFTEGQEVLVPMMGKFSARWADICEAYGIRVRLMEVDAGRSPSPEDVRWELVQHEGITGLLLTHCETSTGALTDLAGITKAVQGLETRGRTILRVADCVSSFCVDELRMDAWGLDCVIAASHKGLLSPAGLSIVAVGPRAAAAMEQVPPRNYYLNLRKYFARAFRSSTPFTPSLSLMYAIGAAIDRIMDIGLVDVLDWEKRAAQAVKVAIKAAGFDTLAQNQSSAVVAFKVGGRDPEALCGVLEETHGMYIARGQGNLHGKVLRVSPLGKTRQELVDFTVALLETVSGTPRSNEVFGVQVSKVVKEVENILKGRDIWA
jgi:aspartate aminotransferase-like enzyme